MAKGERNRAIRRFATMMVNDAKRRGHRVESAQSYARRLRRQGWKRVDVE